MWRGVQAKRGTQCFCGLREGFAQPRRGGGDRNDPKRLQCRAAFVKRPQRRHGLRRRGRIIHIWDCGNPRDLYARTPPPSHPLLRRTCSPHVLGGGGGIGFPPFSFSCQFAFCVWRRDGRHALLLFTAQRSDQKRGRGTCIVGLCSLCVVCGLKGRVATPPGGKCDPPHHCTPFGLDAFVRSPFMEGVVSDVV